MMSFGGDAQLKKLDLEDEPIPEELDRQDWVPNNLIVESRRLEDGATTMYYIHHIENLMLTMEDEVMERVVKGRATCMNKTTLQGKYNWIPEGWAMEIRVGWEGKTEKLFKLFVHKSSGVRLLSKVDVLVFEQIVEGTQIPASGFSSEKNVLLFEEVVKERKVPRGNTEIKCDISSQDNIIAQLDFYTGRLSAGWVKETVFRKCGQGAVKKDLKSAEQYFWTNKNRKDVWSSTQSISKKYFLDKCQYIEEEKPESSSSRGNGEMTSS